MRRPIKGAWWIPCRFRARLIIDNSWEISTALPCLAASVDRIGLEILPSSTNMTFVIDAVDNRVAYSPQRIIISIQTTLFTANREEEGLCNRAESGCLPTVT